MLEFSLSDFSTPSFGPFFFFPLIDFFGTFNCKRNMTISRSKFIIFHGQFSILSALSIEAIRTSWHVYCNTSSTVGAALSFLAAVFSAGEVIVASETAGVNGNGVAPNAYLCLNDYKFNIFQ